MQRFRVVPSSDELIDSFEDSHHITSHDGGGGGGGGMSERIERLERKVDSIESALSRLNGTLVKIDHRIDLQNEKLSSAIELQSCKLTSALEAQSDKLALTISQQAQNLTSAINIKATEFDVKLRDQKLAIVFWVLTLPGIGFGIYKFIEMLAK